MMFKSKIASIAAGVAAIALTASVSAQTEISADERAAAVAALAQVIEDEFFDEARAREISADLRARIADGAFDDVATAEELAATISETLHAEDRHFGVDYVGPEAAAAAMQPRDGQAGPRPDRLAAARRVNFGFAEVEILDGNVGYIRLNMFAPIAPARDTARAALEFVANTDAVIFDLRGNGGGDPTMVQFLISHFVEPGGETLINTFVSRDYEYPNQMWSLPSHPAGHRPEVPLYVLISGRTGSAGEAFPYHLRAMERATLIGETTYGAGNPGGRFMVEEGFSIFVSTGSARNPITNTNWEGTGVEPHIETPAEQALDRALAMIYPQLAEQTENPRQRLALEWAAEALAARFEPVPLSAEDLQAYAGSYGIRQARVEGDTLVYQREGNDPIALIPLGDHRFAFSDEAGYRIIFTPGRDGRAQSMDLHLVDGRVVANPRED